MPPASRKFELVEGAAERSFQARREIVHTLWREIVSELEISLRDILIADQSWIAVDGIRAEQDGPKVAIYQVTTDADGVHVNISSLAGTGTAAWAEVSARYGERFRDLEREANQRCRRLLDVAAHCWHLDIDRREGYLAIRGLAHIDLSPLDRIAAAERDRTGKPVVFRGVHHLGGIAGGSNNEPVSYFATEAIHAASYAGHGQGWVAILRVDAPERLVDLSLALHLSVEARIKEERKRSPEIEWTSSLLGMRYFKIDVVRGRNAERERNAQKQAEILNGLLDAQYRRPLDEMSLGEREWALAYPNHDALEHLRTLGFDGAWLPSGELFIRNEALPKLTSLVVRPAA